MRLKSVRFGIASNTASMVVGRVLTVLAGIILAKALGRESFGQYYSDQAMILVGAGFYNLGLGEGYRQLLAREPSRKGELLGPALAMRVIAISLYGAAVIAMRGGTSALGVDTMLVVLATLLLSVTEIVSMDLMVSRSYIQASILSVAKGGIVLGAAIAGWLAGGSFRVFVTSYALATAVLTVWSIAAVYPKEIRVRISGCLAVLKASYPYILSIAAFAFTSNWSVNAIRSAYDNAEAGTYLVPWKVYQLVLLVGMSASAVSLPLFHRLDHLQDKVTLRSVLKRIAYGFLFIAGLVMGVCVLLPETIIRVMATDEFRGGVVLLPVLGASASLRLLAIPAENILESLGRQRYRIASLATGAVLCFFLVMVFVPRYGLLGGALSVLAVDFWLLVSLWGMGWWLAPEIVKPRPVVAHLAVVLLLPWSLLKVGNSMVLLAALAFGVLWVGYGWFALGLRHEFSRMLLKSKPAGGGSHEY